VRWHRDEEWRRATADAAAAAAAAAPRVLRPSAAAHAL